MTLLTELAGHYRHGRIEDTKGVTGEGLARLQLNVARRGTRCVGMKTTKTRYDTCTRIRAKSKMSPHQSLPIAVARHHSDHHSEHLVIKFSQKSSKVLATKLHRYYDLTVGLPQPLNPRLCANIALGTSLEESLVGF